MIGKGGPLGSTEAREYAPEQLEAASPVSLKLEEVTCWVGTDKL
jgi:hypothetical protein